MRLSVNSPERPHRIRPVRQLRTRIRRFPILLATAAALTTAASLLAAGAGPAQAATHSIQSVHSIRQVRHAGHVRQARRIRRTRRLAAYRYAVAQLGKWYCYGGTGPSCYDCSGLVYAAYRHVHIEFGRTTYDMLDSGRLIRITRRQARRGDLAFYGTGHVEFYDRGHVTFGAHDTGSRIGYIRFNAYWHPTAYYRVRGAGKLVRRRRHG